MQWVVLLAMVLPACGDDDDDDDHSPDAAVGDDAGADAGPEAAVVLAVASTDEPFFRPFVAPLAGHGVVLAVGDTAVDALEGARATARIAVSRDDASCDECYTLTLEDGVLHVRGGAPLGLQYGAAHALELMGLGFFSPYETYRSPDFPEPVDAGDPALGHGFAPEIAERGVQMHTLHPIEGTFDFWVPSAPGLARAELVLDWLVKNRANLVQWVPLDDILGSEDALADWRAHTIAIVEHAHLRGLRVGLNIQLFGESNLQKAYDLLDEVGTPAEQRAAIEDRLTTLLDGVEIDVLVFSFGEFVGVDPAAFLESAGLASAVMGELRPDVELGGLIHVGDEPELRIEWMGQEMLYYFLVGFIDPPVVPWIHTVMYYDLFDDAGGAYHHESFDEHRAFLVDHLRDGAPIGYQPETAYWVAFDDSVPMYLPVYVRSRLRDLAGLRDICVDEGIDCLQRHMLFSTGWEWGYWQNDWASLRMSYTQPADARALFREMLRHNGEVGLSVADAIADLADVQHRALIEERLAGYVAGSDGVIDLGRRFGIVSQPDPVQIDELVAMTPEERAAFSTSVVDGLARFEDDMAQILGRVEGADHQNDPWLLEIRDGVEIDVLRARFANRTLAAVVASLDGDDGEGALAQAETALTSAREVVARRHAALHYPEPSLLLERTPNPTLYQFGFLEKADTLCYWERERILTANLVRAEDTDVPDCAE